MASLMVAHFDWSTPENDSGSHAMGQDGRRSSPEPPRPAGAGRFPRPESYSGRRCQRPKSLVPASGLATATPGERRSAGDSNPSRSATPTTVVGNVARHLIASTLRIASVRLDALRARPAWTSANIPRFGLLLFVQSRSDG